MTWDNFSEIFDFDALLNPEAKKPPNGATKLAKREKMMLWNWKGVNGSSYPKALKFCCLKIEGTSQSMFPS
eukprot:CAMPEP_0114602248 /NCGR_PEP_ID=MMETSP0125-20121206/24853_1 /TAXON_ID=485358 ORGANISM="Aristerostoma sp., Strain ATCC 50986" /NCGR_SAMPLE_ID=MMETSP0125 /ASSEMBLY_ACC=CAM_ASM_000245 /LENGTH=70 /DNA_ID=CAMNT_0001812259 /DNA_START=243 /DNA_END=456 /DNA_ORIENTATION=-